VRLSGDGGADVRPAGRLPPAAVDEDVAPVAVFIAVRNPDGAATGWAVPVAAFPPPVPFPDIDSRNPDEANAGRNGPFLDDHRRGRFGHDDLRGERGFHDYSPRWRPLPVAPVFLYQTAAEQKDTGGSKHCVSEDFVMFHNVPSVRLSHWSRRRAGDCYSFPNPG